MEPACFVEFRVHDPARFEMLRAAFEALREDKRLCNAGQRDALRDDDYYLQFFDADARSFFRWPTPTGPADPTHQRSWTFGSMIEMFYHCDFALGACRIASEGVGRLDFYPFGFPYGGTGCIRALIRSFGFDVIGEDDGGGYRPLGPGAP